MPGQEREVWQTIVDMHQENTLALVNATSTLPSHFTKDSMGQMHWTLDLLPTLIGGFSSLRGRYSNFLFL